MLVDDGKLERLYNYVYYLSYITILGMKGRISIDRYIDKKYLNINGETSGYSTGLQIVNKHGFTTQNPSCFEICSNEATIKQQKQIIDGNTVIVYKPAIRITSQNKSALQFLDLMTVIDKYSELSGPELRAWLRKYVDNKKVDYSLVKEYLPLYPDKVYRNIYHGVNRLTGIIGMNGKIQLKLKQQKSAGQHRWWKGCILSL